MNPLILVPLLLAGLAGCTSLLPRGSTETPSPFQNYHEAQTAAERVVPFQTRVAELPVLGLDPARGKNVTIIPYPEIIARLAPYSGVPLEYLDAGIRACILARSECRGYLFRFEREDRRREGIFLIDFLNLKRTTSLTGWWFESLVVISGDTVLFRNTAGQPHIERVESQTNPLGPLQRTGEGAGSLIVN